MALRWTRNSSFVRAPARSNYRDPSPWVLAVSPLVDVRRCSCSYRHTLLITVLSVSAAPRSRNTQFKQNNLYKYTVYPNIVYQKLIIHVHKIIIITLRIIVNQCHGHYTNCISHFLKVVYNHNNVNFFSALWFFVIWIPYRELYIILLYLFIF